MGKNAGSAASLTATPSLTARRGLPADTTPDWSRQGSARPRTTRRRWAAGCPRSMQDTRPLRMLAPTHRCHPVIRPAAQPLGKGGVAAPGALGADRPGQGTLAADQHHDLLGPGDGGVEQVALQHQPGAGGQGDDHTWVLAALGAVDADRMGVGQLVQLVEPIGDLLVLIQQDAEFLLLERECGDHPDRPVEHAGGALVVVVPELHDLVSDPVDEAAEPALREPLSRWRQRDLEPLVEHARAG